MASTKKLSNGTLGLRFMQNAKNLQKFRQDTDPVKVHNEAEWTVPGYRSGGRVAADEYVSYESSYLPFLYPAQEHAGDGSSRPTNGRRIFKQGKEHAGSIYEDAREEQTRTDGDEAQQSSSEIKHHDDVLEAARTPVSTGSVIPTPTGFVRPGGVDAPPAPNVSKLGSASQTKKPKREAEESTQLKSRKKIKKED